MSEPTGIEFDSEKAFREAMERSKNEIKKITTKENPTRLPDVRLPKVPEAQRVTYTFSHDHTGSYPMGRHTLSVDTLDDLVYYN